MKKQGWVLLLGDCGCGSETAKCQTKPVCHLTCRSQTLYKSVEEHDEQQRVIPRASLTLLHSQSPSSKPTKFYQQSKTD